VTFPRRAARAPLLVRLIGSTIARVNPHGRSGPYAFLYVLGSYSRGTAENSPNKPMPTTIIVGHLAAAKTELSGCTMA